MEFAGFLNPFLDFNAAASAQQSLKLSRSAPGTLVVPQLPDCADNF